MDNDERTGEIWILGATGRVGGGLARRLTDQGVGGVVLVGRDDRRLASLAADLAVAVRTVVIDDVDAMADAIREERPRVVVNVLGSFAETGPVIASACMPGGRYVDLASDLRSIAGVLDLGDDAVRAGSTLISGAGFGVVAVEAPLVALCEGREAPARVRVDALASFASKDGTMGEAFAATAVDIIATGGRRYRDGKLVRTRLGSRRTRHLLPDGTRVRSAAVPSGELYAAQRVSGAPDVDFTSALAPTNLVVVSLLPLMSRLLRRPSVRHRIMRAMAASTTKAAPRPRPHSWGHAVAEWADGTRIEGWMRTDDAMDFTTAVISAVVLAAGGDGVPAGAFTPASAFGPDIARAAGAELIIGDVNGAEVSARARPSRPGEPLA